MTHQKSASARYRLNRINDISIHGWSEEQPPARDSAMTRDVSLELGWGRLIFGQTFSSHDRIIKCLAGEKEGRRDLAFYIHDHHVLISKAPELLFLDPSDTYRLWLHNYRMPKRKSRAFRLRLLQDQNDAEEINRIYRRCRMIESPVETILANQKTRNCCYYIAESTRDGRICGTITGVDHKEVFNDPGNGASFWCLAVDPDTREAGIGRALVREVAEYFLAKGRAYLDLSVLHNNQSAKHLYRSLGFRKIPVYLVKKKNRINRHLYMGGPQP